MKRLSFLASLLFISFALSGCLAQLATSGLSKVATLGVIGAGNKSRCERYYNDTRGISREKRQAMLLEKGCRTEAARLRK